MTYNNIFSSINNNYEKIFITLISLTIFTILFFQSSSSLKNISIKTTSTTNKWSEHLKRLKLINYIAIMMFISSLIRVSYDLQGLGRFLFSKSFLPLLGLLMSLTYFFGFFGVTIASSLFDDNDSNDSNNDIIVDLNRSPNDGKSIPLDSTDRIIVVGGGVAGCTAALALANKGHAVTLIERDLSEQDRIVGELLQPGGIRALERLGIDDCAKDGIDSVNVQGYVVIDPTILDSNGVAVKQILKYPKSDPVTSSEYFGYVNNDDNNDNNNDNNNSPLGRSFHHGKFVQRLREKAILHPSIHVIEGTVTKLIEEKDNTIVGVEYKVIEKINTDDNGSINTTDSDELIINKNNDNNNHNTIKSKPKVYQLYSKLTLVADGIWSSQRKHLSPSVVQTSDSWVGIIVKHESMKSPIPYPLHGHVILTEPSPCLIYQISSTETRVLVDIKGKLPSISDGSMEVYMKEKIAPQMPESFRPAFIEAITPGNPRSSEFKSMPSKYFSAQNSLKKGAFLIGDSLNMRNPLTGGGMTVCIRDGELLSHYFSDIDLTKYGSQSTLGTTTTNKDNKSISDLHELLSKRYQMFLSKRINYAGTINVLACALHGVFSTPNGDETRRQLRQACYDYLNLGGVYSAGPIGLLSGLTPKPLVLTTHFFLVALYGSSNIISKSGLTFNSLNRIHKLLCVACTIIMPLLKIEQTTVLSSWFLQNAASVLFPPIQEMMTEEE